MGLKVSGLRERITALDLLASRVLDEVQKELMSAGGQMAISAKSDHRFVKQSGNLERSIVHDVPEGEMKLTLGFVDDATRSNWSKVPGATYGTFQHEGTGQGYERSAAADKHEHNQEITGIKADHFLVRAWDKYIGGMCERLEKGVVEIVKKAVEDGVF